MNEVPVEELFIPVRASVRAPKKEQDEDCKNSLANSRHSLRVLLPGHHS